MSANNTAIIITDPYNDFLHPKGKLNGMIAESLAEKNVLAHLKELVDTARAHHIPIYYGLHQQLKPGFLGGWKHATKLQQGQVQSTGFAEGSWGAEVYGGLEPQVSNGDVVVSKHWCSRFVAEQCMKDPLLIWCSSFQNTDLDYQLHQREITNLVLAGMTANTCLEATARYAYEL
jgi:nicotinamidase-related amidase